MTVDPLAVAERLRALLAEDGRFGLSLPGEPSWHIENAKAEAVKRALQNYSWHLPPLLALIESQSESLRIAREALGYYANDEHYDSGDVPCHIYILDDHGRMARTALDAMGKGDGWLPIETAPHACHVLATRFDELHGEWIYGVVLSPPLYPFTDWRPLPTPPAHKEG